ncbi:MAG: hypothetical protein JWN18_346 [Parcubacteria group bacterium]|nr:hypothetical protein [Parcubacteria group bacterium]
MDTPESVPTPTAVPETIQTAQTPAAVHKNTLMAALAYLGILVIIPYLAAKDDSFVKFHIKQGLVLLVIEAVVWVLGTIFWGYGMMFWALIRIINLGTLIISIIGIVNAVQGNEKELPLVGQYGRNFNI